MHNLVYERRKRRDEEEMKRKEEEEKVAQTPNIAKFKRNRENERKKKTNRE